MPKPDLMRRYIAETFKALVKESDYDSVTVTRVIEACEINRKTFYYHFFSRADLATYVFRKEFASYLEVRMGKARLTSDADVEDDKYREFPCYYLEYSPEDHVDFFWTLSSYVKDEVWFYRKLFASSDWKYFSDYIFKIFHPLTRRDVCEMIRRRNVELPEEEVEYLSDYFTNCSVIWVINRHVAQHSHYSDAAKKNLGSLIYDAMKGAVEARCSRAE